MSREWQRAAGCWESLATRAERRSPEEPARNSLRVLAFTRKKPTWLASALSLNPGVAFVRYFGFKLRGQDSNEVRVSRETATLPAQSLQKSVHEMQPITT